MGSYFTMKYDFRYKRTQLGCVMPPTGTLFTFIKSSQQKKNVGVHEWRTPM